MPYTPHTKQETKQMLDAIGFAKEDNLFDVIPNNIKNTKLNLGSSLDEFSIFEKFKKIANKNDTSKLLFMGGGYYDHIVPSAVDALSLRSEFYTSYTPYQAEASIGTLGVLYEFQSLMCELSGMDISNASMYDGATALAEGALMAVRIKAKNKIVVCGGVSFIILDILKTYLKFRNIDLVVIDSVDTLSDKEKLKNAIDEQTAGFIFSVPNFFGSIDDYESLISHTHKQGALAIMNFYPIASPLLKDAGSLDVDIACGDGLSLGNYLNLGGPSLGILVSKSEFIRNLPGRLIGKTTDKYNNEAFTLTMQAREQHIRRDRATSNICSNQNLLALRATIFLSLLGKEGFYALSLQNYNKGNYFKELLEKIDGVEVLNKGEIFNEFVYKVTKSKKSSKEILNFLEQKGIYGGINLELAYESVSYSKNKHKNEILVSVSEKRSKEDMLFYAKCLKELT